MPSLGVCALPNTILVSTHNFWPFATILFTQLVRIITYDDFIADDAGTELLRAIAVRSSFCKLGLIDQKNMSCSQYNLHLHAYCAKCLDSATLQRWLLNGAQ